MNLLRIDPTRTTALVQQLVDQMRARCNALTHAVEKLIGEDDVFGLGEGTDGEPHGMPTANAAPPLARWKFASNPQKVAAYQAWLKVQTQAGLLRADRKGKPWMATWIESSYKKAVVRAYTEAHPEALATSVEGYAEARDRFLADTFVSPITAKRLELLYTRAFEKLKEYTAVMAHRTSTILTDGLAHGTGSRKLAREMAHAMDALTKTRALAIARTEMANAYAEGSLDTYEVLGVENLTVMAEWSTAGDGKVCPTCRPLEGLTLAVKDARGMLPRHPNCRCAWLPAQPSHLNRQMWAGAKRTTKPQPKHNATAARAAAPAANVAADVGATWEAELVATKAAAETAAKEEAKAAWLAAAVAAITAEARP